MNTLNLKRLVLCFIIGVMVSVLFIAIFITAGYFEAYKSMPNNHTVEIVGIPIYDLEKIENEYSGIPNNKNMGFISIVFVIVSVIIGEIFAFKNGKNRNKL